MHPDLVLEGKTGFTFDPTNEPALAALLRVSGEPALRAEMGREARATWMLTGRKRSRTDSGRPLPPPRMLRSPTQDSGHVSLSVPSVGNATSERTARCARIRTLDPAFGGPPVVCTQLARAQIARGHLVEILTADDGKAGERGPSSRCDLCPLQG